MNAKEVLAALGWIIIGVMVLLVSIALGATFIFGSIWASSKLLSWFSKFTWIAFGLVVFILLPLSIPKATRGFSSVSLLIASYIFGATLWMEGLLLTLAFWGIGAVIIGLLIAGIGVVPIAMLASLINGTWSTFIELVLLVVATYATRIGAMSLAESLEF